MERQVGGVAIRQVWLTYHISHQWTNFFQQVASVTWGYRGRPEKDCWTRGYARRGQAGGLKMGTGAGLEIGGSTLPQWTKYRGLNCLYWDGSLETSWEGREGEKREKGEKRVNKTEKCDSQFLHWETRITRQSAFKIERHLVPSFFNMRNQANQAR